MKIFCNDLAAATKTLINQGLTNTQSIKTSLKNECNKLTDVSYVLPYVSVNDFQVKIAATIVLGLVSKCC